MGGAKIASDLRRKAAALPRVKDDVRLAICAREDVRGDADLIVTAEGIFDI